MNPPIYISEYNTITPLGFSVEATWQSLMQGKTGIRELNPFSALPKFFASAIDRQALETDFPNIGEGYTVLERVLIAALLPLVEKQLPTARTALIVSTTKGNIDCIQRKETSPQQAFLWDTARKVAHFFGITTEPIVVSHACVSGVLAVSVAKNCIQAGMYDDAFVVGGDVLSEFVVSGFQSFQAMSEKPCMPYDAHRSGISLGEAAAAVYLSKEKRGKIIFEILGESAINDANHISGPSRTGEGLFCSVVRALEEAKLSSEEIDFISAHGTATRYNDDMESIAFHRAGLAEKPLHSLKGYFGHTLGASGLLELVVALEASQRNILIPTRNYTEQGTAMPLNIIENIEQKPIDVFLKTASGFGGSNAAMVIKKHK